MAVKGYFIQYKFILPESIKHSSYTYQKLFRALYGYTQAVYKSNGKIYQYYRRGVLSNIPYIRPGKNCVIIPPGTFNTLTEFFKTGKNPTHKWHVKGDWKAVYYMNEKNIDEKQVMSSLEALLDRTHVSSNAKDPSKLLDELQNKQKQEKTEPNYINLLKSESQAIVNSIWFKDVYLSSEKLKLFYDAYKDLKGK
ncbi:MAG: hypothetical protein V1672_05690 [Candidatus Diapherotrites archaeon]